MRLAFIFLIRIRNIRLSWAFMQEFFAETTITRLFSEHFPSTSFALKINLQLSLYDFCICTRFSGIFQAQNQIQTICKKEQLPMGMCLNVIHLSVICQHTQTRNSFETEKGHTKRAKKGLSRTTWAYFTNSSQLFFPPRDNADFYRIYNQFFWQNYLKLFEFSSESSAEMYLANH